MIPKTIHYCWFGGKPLPELAVRCMESWRRYCPDYEIVEWNETNYSIEDACQFVLDAYSNAKWAFVSDYVRLDVVYRYGGIYLDTDVELLKCPEEILKDSRGFLGREQDHSVNTGLGFACEAGEPLLEEMMALYRSLKFEADELSDFACPVINTRILMNHGMTAWDCKQRINGIDILPTEYLCPENMYTGKSNYTEHTISVHHYNGSWLSERERKKIRRMVWIKKRLPESAVAFFRRSLRIMRGAVQ